MSIERELHRKLDQIIDQTSASIAIDPGSMQQGAGWTQSLPFMKSGHVLMIQTVALNDGIEIVIKGEEGYVLWRQRLRATGAYRREAIIK